MLTENRIFYKSGYKYQLAKDYHIWTAIFPKTDILTTYLAMDTKGNLTISVGYAWDGPSGPTFDTPSFMRASLVHDALFQLMRLGFLDRKWREKSDDLLRAICLEDGMNHLRAWWVWRAVRRFGKGSTMPDAEKKVEVAPR